MDFSQGTALWTMGQFFILIGVLAAGLKGIRYLVLQGIEGSKWGLHKVKERRRRDTLLDEVLGSQGWPNGAENIIESHQDMYNLARTTDSRVAALQGQIADLQTAIAQLLNDRKVG